MKPEILAAETDAQREAIYGLRYDIYVEEMNRYWSIADHENRRLTEPEDDARSRHYLAVDGDKVIGTMRLTWGGDASFTKRHIDQYDLWPFVAEVPEDQMIIGERFMVRKDYRGTDLIFRLFCTYLNFVNDNRIQLIFGDSEPHLLNLYQGLGFRTYTKKNINSAETGYLIPLLMIPEDMDYMRAIRSPLTDVLTDFGADARVPACLPGLLAKGSAVKNTSIVPKELYWRDIESALNLAECRAGLFDGLSEHQMHQCLSKSNVIECRKGDRIIKKGNVAQNMFVVLSGILEVRDGEEIISLAGAGDIVGEMAFLLESSRSMDVCAATDGVRILSLSESVIKKMIAQDSEAAAALLLNVSKMLCYKLLGQN